MFNRMNHLGLAYLELTGSYIAKHLPFYTVTLVWLIYIDLTYLNIWKKYEIADIPQEETQHPERQVQEQTKKQ